MSVYDAWWQGQSTHAGQTVGQHLRSWLHMFDRDSLGVTHRLVAQKEPVSPACDVRESRGAYFFDVELPGVADVGAVALRWPSSRTLVIEPRPSASASGRSGPRSTSTPTCRATPAPPQTAPSAAATPTGTTR